MRFSKRQASFQLPGKAVFFCSKCSPAVITSRQRKETAKEKKGVGENKNHNGTTLVILIILYIDAFLCIYIVALMISFFKVI